MRYEENPADAGKLVLIGGVALAAWWVWSNFFSTPAAPASTAGAPTTPPVQTPTTATNTSAAASTWSLASLYSAMIAKMKSAGDPAVTIGSDGTVTASPDVFDWYLQNVTNSPVASGPPVAFSDHTTPITSTAYWAGMAPLLTSQLGLSGGQFFAGLGNLCQGMNGGRR